MHARDRKVPFIVSTATKRGEYWAKTPGGAVAQFARQYHLSLRADHETGGWKGVSVEVKSR